MSNENKERGLFGRDEVRVWGALICDNNAGFGIGEEELLKTTGLNREALYRVLVPLAEQGIVECRLQQIGTGGTRDHFYRLKESHVILVRVKTPK